jgi:hypothetical protein
MTAEIRAGDRVRHIHDPAVAGTVTDVSHPLDPALPVTVNVQWEDGYSFIYAEHVLARED